MDPEFPHISRVRNPTHSGCRVSYSSPQVTHELYISAQKLAQPNNYIISVHAVISHSPCLPTNTPHARTPAPNPHRPLTRALPASAAPCHCLAQVLRGSSGFGHPRISGAGVHCHPKCVSGSGQVLFSDFEDECAEAPPNPNPPRCHL